MTVVLFINSPVLEKFGILEEGHNTLRVAINFKIKRNNTNYFKFESTIEGHDEISMVVRESDSDGERVSRISSFTTKTVSI